jgi:NADH-quinone oxidoreductase subunit J
VSHLAILAAGGTPGPGEAAITQNLVFWILAVISVVAGVGMILARRAVHCVLLLAVIMLSLAVLYAMAGAPFLAFVQVIVYTGAVLMLFLFVLMLVGVSSADSIVETIKGQRLAAGVAGIAMLVLLTLGIGHAAIGGAQPLSASTGAGNVSGLAALIFTKYVFPFEVTSALLITAALGAMVLAHRERTAPKPTQRQLSMQRIAGSHPAPLPGPGTYAQHNAADMPALLPDGTPSELSVSSVISRRTLGGEPRPGQSPEQVEAPPAEPAGGSSGEQAGATPREEARP